MGGLNLCVGALLIPLSIDTVSAGEPPLWLTWPEAPPAVDAAAAVVVPAGCDCGDTAAVAAGTEAEEEEEEDCWWTTAYSEPSMGPHV